jgi:thiol-disulfide isomerase/thioredoxin
MVAIESRVAGSALLASIAVALVWVAVKAVAVWRQPPLVQPGHRAPWSTVLPLRDIDGRSLPPLQGQPVLLDFWQASCAPCLAAQPVFERIRDRHSEQGLRVLAVHGGGTEDEIRAVVQERRDPVTVVHDSDFRMARAFGVFSFPTVILVDPAGRVAAVHRKGAAEAWLEKDVRRMLAEASRGP